MIIKQHVLIEHITNIGNHFNFGASFAHTEVQEATIFVNAGQSLPPGVFGFFVKTAMADWRHTSGMLDEQIYR